MCGICGIVDYSRNGGVDELTLQAMCRAMFHRGPDDGGIYRSSGTAPAAGLGHRRLSIIDLSAAGRQPMSNEDNTVHLALNGEIYNFQELRSGLQEKGHKFVSTSDTECVIHLYEEHGRDCVKYLRGMFAFAIWDEKKKSLLLARDRLGKKSLLYSNKDGRFCFASEFGGLLASGYISKEIQPRSIENYLSFGYIPAPMSVYRDVLKLLPAHTLLLKDGEVSIERYWQLDYSRKIKISEGDARQELIRIFKEALKLRLYSDVPLGVLLSGGIDSGAVVAFMAELGAGQVNTFSIGFDEPGYDELPYAKAVAGRYGTTHHEFRVTPDLQQILPVLVEHYGEPYADSSAVPTYYVCKMAAGSVKVALNGDGGDEAFAGYERYQAYLFSEHYRKIPLAVRNLIKLVLNSIPCRQEQRNALRRLRRFAAGAELSGLDRYFYWAGIFGPRDRTDLFSAEFRKNPDFDSYAQLSSSLAEPQGLQTLDRLLRIDTLTALPNDLLVKVDIASMANSLELRAPFLDHCLFEFAASLPVEYKLRMGTKKYLLKRMLKGRLPEAALRRKKMGFGVPIGSWFRTKLRAYLSDNLLSEKSLGRGYFVPQRVKYLVERHTSGSADHAQQLWALLMLELWHQRFMDR